MHHRSEEENCCHGNDGQASEPYVSYHHFLLLEVTISEIHPRMWKDKSKKTALKVTQLLQGGGQRFLLLHLLVTYTVLKYCMLKDQLKSERKGESTVSILLWLLHFCMGACFQGELLALSREGKEKKKNFHPQDLKKRNKKTGEKLNNVDVSKSTVKRQEGKCCFTDLWNVNWHIRFPKQVQSSYFRKKHIIRNSCPPRSCRACKVLMTQNF